MYIRNTDICYGKNKEEQSKQFIIQCNIIEIFCIQTHFFVYIVTFNSYLPLYLPHQNQNIYYNVKKLH